MRKSRQIVEAEMRGSLAATEELFALGVDQSRPIDVFSIIESQGVWLVFTDLGNALGLFLREGAKGILINNRRPRSLQRLTAAHEYGHFRMGHIASLDDHESVEGTVAEEQEAEAQAFAMDFIMPLELVESTWDLLNLPSKSEIVAPHEVYQLALSMGVSYRACVVQLGAMEKTSKSRTVELLRYKPKDLKRFLTQGVGPVDPWADVWPLEESDHGRTLEVRVRDEIRLKLEETPSTGYRWLEHEEGNFDVLQPTGDEFEGMHPEGGVVGSGGHRFLSYRAVEVGGTRLILQLSRPWAAAKAKREFFVNLNVNGNASGGEQTGLRTSVQSLMIAGAGS